ncbi:MAG: AmmeMemoRadiSam system protein B [Deltaproteobacteria bacterium]|nr:AmmeMemoRadiSam system protein B [Deltaproteobacteria bacterium]
MPTPRKPAVAGLFYPADAGELRAMIGRYLAEARPGEGAPKAIIVPHAGYVYSGPIAAAAYARVASARGRVRRVVLLGPAHRVRFSGLAVSSADAFRTPLGEVPIDAAAVASIMPLPQVSVLDEAHAEEHSLEVQLPFLQEILGDFSLVPLAVGDAGAAEVGEVIEKLWGGDETLIVISSDLSHYLDYESARLRDEATSRAIEALGYEDISYDDACGRDPVNGLLFVARKRGMQAERLDLRNSGDTAGTPDRVVGYGAYAFA